VNKGKDLRHGADYTKKITTLDRPEEVLGPHDHILVMRVARAVRGMYIVTCCVDEGLKVGDTLGKMRLR
jgi:hypothetical protein